MIDMLVTVCRKWMRNEDGLVAAVHDHLRRHKIVTFEDFRPCLDDETGRAVPEQHSSFNISQFPILTKFGELLGKTCLFHCSSLSFW